MVNLGVKGYSDGMMATFDNRLIYASQEESAVYIWDLVSVCMCVCMHAREYVFGCVCVCFCAW